MVIFFCKVHHDNPLYRPDRTVRTSDNVQWWFEPLGSHRGGPFQPAQVSPARNARDSQVRA